MNGPPRRIMIVDDNEPTRRALARDFARIGWQVLSVADGLEATQYVRSTSEAPPDAFIVDLKMPGSSGVELIRIIRLIRTVSRHTGRVAFILACTCATPGTPLVAEAVAAGADAIVFKPCDFERLVDVIRGRSPGDDPETGEEIKP